MILAPLDQLFQARLQIHLGLETHFSLGFLRATDSVLYEGRASGLVLDPVVRARDLHDQFSEFIDRGLDASADVVEGVEGIGLRSTEVR